MTLHTYSDGGARGNPGPAGIGVVVCDAGDQVVEETARCIGEMTNNMAEYHALTLALELARKRGATHLVCYGDSELIIYQMQGVYRIKEARLAALAAKAREVAAHFDKVEYRQVPRSHPLIARADRLLNQALDKARAAAPAKRPPAGQGDLF